TPPSRRVRVDRCTRPIAFGPRFAQETHAQRSAKPRSLTASIQALADRLAALRQRGRDESAPPQDNPKRLRSHWPRTSATRLRQGDRRESPKQPDQGSTEVQGTLCHPQRPAEANRRFLSFDGC